MEGVDTLRPMEEERRRKYRLRLKEQVLADLDMLNHPKGDLLFDIAWDDVVQERKFRGLDDTPTLDEVLFRAEKLSHLMNPDEGQEGVRDTARNIVGTRETTELMRLNNKPRLVVTAFQVFLMDGTVMTVTPRVRRTGEEGPSLYLNVSEDKDE